MILDGFLVKAENTIYFNLLACLHTTLVFHRSVSPCSVLIQFSHCSCSFEVLQSLTTYHVPLPVLFLCMCLILIPFATSPCLSGSAWCWLLHFFFFMGQVRCDRFSLPQVPAAPYASSTSTYSTLAALLLRSLRQLDLSASAYLSMLVMPN